MTANNMSADNVFGRIINLPDSDADSRLANLVGIDDAVRRLDNMLELLIFPDQFEDWKKLHHAQATRLFNYVGRRHPLIILAGDVGTGKTELSETIGSRVARRHKVEITVFPLSLSSRGSGLVGEMTNLLSNAFSYVENECRGIAKGKDGKYKSGIILLIDEADALAQSRESEQMHHEDKAGVNALIRGIDSLNRSQLPVAVIMCTNRLSAIDPAVMRRACEVIEFVRPDSKQRQALLGPVLMELGFTSAQIDHIVELTGAAEECAYGFTYSDITQKLFNSMVMSAFPHQSITYEQTLKALKEIKPTPPFKDA